MVAFHHFVGVRIFHDLKCQGNATHQSKSMLDSSANPTMLQLPPARRSTSLGPAKDRLSRQKNCEEGSALFCFRRNSTHANERENLLENKYILKVDHASTSTILFEEKMVYLWIAFSWQRTVDDGFAMRSQRSCR